MPYNNHSYLDPLHIVWRNGTPDDPYVDRAEYLKILNHKVVLSEIPDRFTRVKVAGMFEINYEGTPKKVIMPNQFSVNYSTGVIEFHASQESKSVNVTYKGRGFIQYPSSRIYHQDEFNNVVESLEDIINRAIIEIREIDIKTTDYQKIRDELLLTMVKMETAITESKESTEKSEIATDMALNAYETTRLVFQPFVNTYNQILTNYPNPEIGWTVQVYDTGIRYRWDGARWVPIDLFGGNMPLANENLNGLMNKDDYKKLKSFDDRLKERVVVFVIPQYPDIGVQHINARFPFKGEIKNIRAMVGWTDATADTEIAVQKSRDMKTWTNLMSRQLVIKKDENFDDGLKVIDNLNVVKDDIFRIELLQVGSDIQDITLEIIIKITQ
ncbi:hypothetical protein [Paenibacillus agilis]|uniref:Uncharacterized protein n=1 Tax=Paenibacillus agilis TaxID=3020863 RepID=A0A559IEJ7_9BACL|nr:hypothetical protein [Paenibacillus agilis]TVX86087.1 hypothetical protein FPZ44_24435 [Paenibacillus agilis]